MKKMLVGLAAPLLSAGLAHAAQVGDWPNYGRDPGGARFSPLTQITPANVGRLRVAWTYHMNPLPGTPGPVRGNETTPLVVDGRMYVGTPYGRLVALDATTGKQIWAYQLPQGDQPALRGVSYWSGDARHGPRIIVGTQRGLLIAVDARSGEPAAGFGDNGLLNTRTPEVMGDFPNAAYGYSSPPSIYKNVIITGSRVQERPSKGPAGDARGWDAVTGKLLWTFHSIPQPGERFHETWEGDGWRQKSGVNMWGMSTVDAERGIAYLAFGAPTYDRHGGAHKGDNLFSSSVVAVEAATGKYLWHFQATHHDIWDFDLNTPPTLLTVRKDGRTIPAVAVMNKAALLFLLDRVTGEPIHGVTERPVPPSTAEGEFASPTQPFPNKPEPLTRMSFDLSELADITPEHTAACKAIVERDGIVGSTMYEPRRDDAMSVIFPGGAGGAQWAGGAFDPRRRLFVFNSNQMGYAEKLVKGADGEWGVQGGRFQDPATRSPCHKPPWGELIAVNVDTGDVAWRSILGVSDHFPPGKQQTGRPSNGGPTLTASGLAFMAGADDSRFRAFDTQTGKELWTYRLDHSAHATPITYQGRDGRQYVAVVATGGSVLNSPAGGDSVMVFALP